MERFSSPSVREKIQHKAVEMMGSQQIATGQGGSPSWAGLVGQGGEEAAPD